MGWKSLVTDLLGRFNLVTQEPQAKFCQVIERDKMINKNTNNPVMTISSVSFGMSDKNINILSYMVHLQRSNIQHIPAGFFDVYLLRVTIIIDRSFR